MTTSNCWTRSGGGVFQPACALEANDLFVENLVVFVPKIL